MMAKDSPLLFSADSTFCMYTLASLNLRTLFSVTQSFSSDTTYCIKYSTCLPLEMLPKRKHKKKNGNVDTLEHTQKKSDNCRKETLQNTLM